jgi:hypothetical protein
LMRVRGRVSALCAVVSPLRASWHAPPLVLATEPLVLALVLSGSCGQGYVVRVMWSGHGLELGFGLKLGYGVGLGLGIGRRVRVRV